MSENDPFGGLKLGEVRGVRGVTKRTPFGTLAVWLVTLAEGGALTFFFLNGKPVESAFAAGILGLTWYVTHRRKKIGK